MKRKVALTAVIVISILIVSIVTGYYIGAQTRQRLPIQSVSNYYLPMQDGSGESRIFVVSANASYGSYPFPTVTRPPSFVNNDLVIARNGEPCVIVNVTLRNDYSNQFPAPKPIHINSSLVYVSLTAKIYNNQEVSSKDITNAFPLSSLFTNSGFTSLHYGENTTLSIYLATNNTDITRFQLHPRYIGAMPPP